MAGKKRRGRAGWKAKFAAYSSENRLEKNKARKQETHEKRVLKQIIRTEERLELLEKALEKTKLNHYLLKRKFGTLNIKRLTDIVNGTTQTAEWFVLRLTKDENKRNEQKKNMHKRKLSVQMSKGREKTKTISGSREDRNGELSLESGDSAM